METILTKEVITINHLKSVANRFKESCGEITGIEQTDFDIAIENMKDNIMLSANPETPISVLRPHLLFLNEVMFLMKDLTAALNL